MQYGAAATAQHWDEVRSAMWKQRRGSAVDAILDPPPDSFYVRREGLPWPTSQHVMALGRVRLRDAILHRPPADAHPQMTVWRGGSAVLESLHLPPDFDDHGGVLCAALTARYGVGCGVGYPPYTQADWDERTILDAPGVPSHEDLGCFPPGVQQRGCRRVEYSRVTVPPRPSRYWRATA